MHKGTRTVFSPLEHDLQSKIDILLDEFVQSTNEQAKAPNIRLATIRSRLQCNIIVIIDEEHISLIGQISHGTPTSRYVPQEGKKFTINDLHKVARFDFGFNDYFIVILPKQLLSQSTVQRSNEINSIAQAYVSSELERVNQMINIVQVSPLFGAAKYQLDEKLVFVLMAYNEKRDKIYNGAIKPTIESNPLNLVCKRADEINSNKTIMQDIWKSICEARIIIADLSDLNPNVMYELGIAHTVGKDTIILYENDNKVKFPFDLTHIRRIEYTNELTAANKLKTDLTATLQSILSGKNI